jgi:hypothetical protein
VSRRLLVLSFHAPPENAVGGLRWAGLSRHLAQHGWEVRMITASAGAEHVRHPQGMTVREVHRKAILADHYEGWRKRGKNHDRSLTDGGRERPSRGGGSGPGVDRAPERRRRGSIRTALADLLTFPDGGRGWLLLGARATRQAILEWMPDLVVSTGPPHSVHLAADAALRGTGIPWVVDLRDPWATPLHRHSPRGWSLAMLRRLEARVFSRASLLITTTLELRDELRARFPGVLLAWLPNGVDTRELPPRPAELGAGLSLCHLGTVYFQRDPTPVVQAFARFLAANPAAASQGSTLRFVGSVEPAFRRSLERTAAELGIGAHVEVKGAMPREKALDIMARSGMALVLAQGQGPMVPAKLYEAVGMGMPTLVIAELDSATAREANRLSAAAHEPEDISGMAATMEAVWTGDARTDATLPELVDHARLALDLEELLDSVLRQTPSSLLTSA